jgi:hypothetical protein
MSNRRSHPTADNILANMDLCNKSILITGANQGIGRYYFIAFDNEIIY